MAYQLIPGMYQPVSDTTFTKVFVGGLAWETRSDSLWRYFEQFGEVLEASVVTDKSTGRSKGYGFVTFQDPEAAKRACADPTPLIDGRWANCNLASLGRPQLIPLHGHLKTANSYIGGVKIVQRDYHGSFQQPLPYCYYQQGYLYSPYGSGKSGSCGGYLLQPVFINRNETYGPKYLIPPEICNPYADQQYLPMYEAPGATIPTMDQYGRLGQTVPSGRGYSAMQGLMMPDHHIMQFGGVGVNGLATSAVPIIQASYPSGNAAAVPAQPQFLLPISPVLYGDPGQIVL